MDTTVLDKEWKILRTDYKLLKKIGSGTFGEVIQAKHRATGTACAIKLIKTDLKTQVDCRNLYRELTILR